MSESVLNRGALRNVAPVLQLSLTMRLQKIGLNPTLLTGLVLLAIVILVAIAAPLLTPYDPIVQSLGDAFQPPLSANHILGTDNFGRDVWSRIVYGTRLDLQIGLFSVLFPFVFGTLLGIATGYLGGWLDTLFMRLVDVLMAFPFLILVVAIMSILGPPEQSLYRRRTGGVDPVRAHHARRNARHAQSRIRASRAHDRVHGAAYHAAPRPAERDRARSGVCLHGHGAGDPDRRDAELSQPGTAAAHA